MEVNEVWTTAWPTEPGQYWFYGWTWLDKSGVTDKPPKFHQVEVFLGGNSNPVYVTRGNFMYKSERHKGLWAPIEFPEPPSIPPIVEFNY